MSVSCGNKRLTVPNSDLSHLESDGCQAIVFRLRTGEGGFGLSELILQLQNLLLVESLFTGRLQNQRLFSAFPICRHLPVRGVSLPKGLKTSRRQT